MSNKIAVVIGTWFGSGFSPVAPGTAGSLAAVVIAVALHLRFGWGQVEFGLLAACLLIPGIWASGVVEVRSGKEDPGIVVVDEVVGQWITLAGATALNWKSWLAAFVVFRLVDIWKPAPVRQLERLDGGTGIMADDVMAGVYGAVLLYAVGRLNLY